MSKLSKLLSNPRELYCWATYKGLTKWVKDETHLKLMYRALMHGTLDLKEPKTYNEKLQWLKLNDHRDIYTVMVDKYRSKEWAETIIGPDCIVKNLRHWSSVEDIDLSGLPERFVLKTNHDNGGVVVCTDRAAFDLELAKKKLGRHLKRDFYYIGREWPYKHVQRVVFAEEYLEPLDGDRDLADYKVVCIGGSPIMIQVHRGRFGYHTQDFYSTDWKRLDMSQGDPVSDSVELPPRHLDIMLDLSSKLSEGVPELRVDWFETAKGLKLGEVTFFDGSGFYPFEPGSVDDRLGELLTLPASSAQ